MGQKGAIPYSFMDKAGEPAVKQLVPAIRAHALANMRVGATRDPRVRRKTQKCMRPRFFGPGCGRMAAANGEC